MLHDVEQPGGEPNSFEFESRRRFETFRRRHTRVPEDLYPMGSKGEREIDILPEQAMAWDIIDGLLRAPATPPP